MNSIIATLLIILNNTYTQDTNYTIAKYIASHYNDVKNMSIRELANACYTSTSSINKFISCLGIDSFSSFKKRMISSYNIRRNQAKKRFQLLSEDKIYLEIQHFNPGIDIQMLDKQLNHIIEMIYASHNIIIIGASFPNALSLNFQEDMIIMNKFVSIQQKNHSKNQLFDTVQLDDFVLVVSIFGTAFSVFSNQIEELANIKNKAIITQVRNNIDKYKFTEKIILPQSQDDEMYNITLFLLYTLLKTKYYYYLKEKGIAI